MNGLGLPTTKAFLSLQVSTDLTIEPVPGTIESGIGNLSSVLVATNSTSGLFKYVAALYSLGKLMCSSKPTTTPPISGSKLKFE